MAFVMGYQVSFSGEVDMICQENLKASIVKFDQAINIPPTAATFKEA